MKDNKLVILSNNTGVGFARAVADYIGAEFIETEHSYHPDGELDLYIKGSIRGADVFLVCPYYPNPLERHSENIIMAGTISDASAGRLTLVPTYLGFQRSDWKPKSRTPLGIKYVAESIESVGVDRVLTMHLHARQIQGVFRIPFDVLQPLPVLKDWCEERGYRGSGIVVVSPDAGGTKYAEECASIIGAEDLGLIWKRRESGGDVDTYRFIGDVEGKVVIMPDDQLSTGNSLRKGAQRLKERHGAKEVYGVVTHAVCAPYKGRLAEDWILEDGFLDGVVVTDTIPRPPEWTAKYGGKIHVRSVVRNFGDAIRFIHENKSLSHLFQY